MSRVSEFAHLSQWGLVNTAWGDMDTEKDFYAILRVLPSIDDVALAAVYRALLKKYHPDVFGGSKAEAERRTREIVEAYEVLGGGKAGDPETPHIRFEKWGVDAMGRRAFLRMPAI